MANSGFRKNDFYFRELSRLTTKYLVQLLSNRFFRRVQSRKREPVSGFFLQQKCKLRTAYISDDVKGPGFHQPIFGFLPEDVELLDSCNGLICCRSSYSSKNPCLYVCNPLKKEWIKINCTNSDDVMVSIGLAFDPCQDITDSSTNFKLVTVPQFLSELEDPYIKFHIYSSDTDSWSISKEICRPGGRIHGKNAIFVEERLHWWTDSERILTYNIKNDEPQVISVPVPVPEDDDKLHQGCIGESDGKLHYIVVSDKRLFIWSLEDFAEVNWNLIYSRPVEVIADNNPFLFPGNYYVWPMVPLAFKDGYLVMKYDLKIYRYEMNTNKMHEVSSVSNGITTIALPYSLSMVPLN